MFGSLFSGIGGIDLGLERAGMKCLWQVEIHDYCLQVLAKHWPNVKRYHDVKECGAHNLEPVDLICGGFPCTPHSLAGKRRGKADDRNLWPEYRRIIAELRPKYVLGENVPGIITTMLDEVLSDLEGEGYATTTIVLPAVAFDAPHRRDRVFIIAHANEYAWNTRRPESERQQRASWTTDGSEDVAHTASKREATVQQQGQICSTKQSSEAMADASQLFSNGGDDNSRCRSESLSQPRDGAEETRSLSSRWPVEPDVGRVANGVPHRVDRLRALGNAVVPQVAQWIGECIVEFDER